MFKPRNKRTGGKKMTKNDKIFYAGVSMGCLMGFIFTTMFWYVILLVMAK
jgi:hypothetical protein